MEGGWKDLFRRALGPPYPRIGRTVLVATAVVALTGGLVELIPFEWPTKPDYGPGDLLLNAVTMPFVYPLGALRVAAKAWFHPAQVCGIVPLFALGFGGWLLLRRRRILGAILTACGLAGIAWLIAFALGVKNLPDPFVNLLLGPLLGWMAAAAAALVLFRPLRERPGSVDAFPGLLVVAVLAVQVDLAASGPTLHTAVLFGLDYRPVVEGSRLYEIHDVIRKVPYWFAAATAPWFLFLPALLVVRGEKLGAAFRLLGTALRRRPGPFFLAHAAALLGALPYLIASGIFSNVFLHLVFPVPTWVLALAHTLLVGPTLGLFVYLTARLALALTEEDE